MAMWLCGFFGLISTTPTLGSHLQDLTLQGVPVSRQTENDSQVTLQSVQQQQEKRERWKCKALTALRGRKVPGWSSTESLSEEKTGKRRQRGGGGAQPGHSCPWNTKQRLRDSGYSGVSNNFCNNTFAQWLARSLVLRKYAGFELISKALFFYSLHTNISVTFSVYKQVTHECLQGLP